jgi:acyl-CoA synthetase (AMP-forming)/AMP-acid ligase II
MPPDDFIRDPLYWLNLFGSYQVTISPAPNSAYLRCAEQIKAEDIQRLDLSSWRSAMNGAESIDPLTMRKFFNRFKIAGFRAEAIMPVYGLAEATLAVAFPPVERGMRSIWTRKSLIGAGIVEEISPDDLDAKEIISVGYPVKGMEIRLHDSNGIRININDRVGEIYIQGDSVTEGYDFDPQATSSAFQAGWFATGDLGFFHQGELYITGRRRELIIVNGQNYYAHDIELVVKQLQDISCQYVMAIGVENEGTQSLVLLVETREIYIDKQKQIISSIREAISLSLGISPANILLLKPNEIPRTSSGKLERHKGLEFYESHTRIALI